MDDENVIELEIDTGNERVDAVLEAIAQKVMTRGEHKSQRAINTDVARSDIFICFYGEGSAARWIAIKGAKLLDKMDTKQVCTLSRMSGMVVSDSQSTNFINRTLGDGGG